MTSNRLVDVRDGGGAVTRTYRAGGAVEQDDRGADVYGYAYDSNGRLTAVQRNGVAVGAYGYDAFGRRVTRQTFGVGAVNLHYVFDGDGRLLSEHDAATGAAVREYVWIDDMPVAVIDMRSVITAMNLPRVRSMREDKNFRVIVVLAGVAILSLAANLWMAYQAIDAGVSYSHLDESYAQTNNACVQAIKVANSLAAGQDAEVIQRAASATSDPVSTFAKGDATFVAGELVVDRKTGEISSYACGKIADR